MAFSFGDIGNIVSGIGGIAGLFRDDEVPAASRSMESAINEAIKLAKASADPNSAAFRNLEELEAEQGRNAAIAGVQNFLRAAARARARGYTGQIINPERRDESVMKSLAESFQDARNAARATARQTLSNAASSLTGAAGGMQPVMNAQFEVNTSNADRRDQIPGAIGNALNLFAPYMDQYAQTPSRGTPGSTRIQLSGSPSFGSRTSIPGGRGGV